MKKIILLFIILCSFYQIKTFAYEIIAENSRFQLFVDKDTTLFYILDKNTKAEFYARPIDWEDDKIALGINRQAMSSLITIRTIDHNHIERISVSSHHSEFEFLEIENGFQVDFFFETQGVAVSVIITLNEYGFNIHVPISGIIEYGPDTLTQVQVLPFFGAGQAGEDGYVFLPDGSGALIDFDAIFSLPQELSRPIFGQDAAMATTTMPNPEQTWHLPVFGIKRNNTAFIGVISEGTAATVLNARVGGDTSQYFRVMPSLIYRARHSLVLFENTSDERSLLRPAPRRLREGLSISYILLSGEDIDYSNMAIAYREYLIRNNLLAQKEITPYLDLTLVGSQRVSRTFLGIPYETLQPLTTFDEARLIIEILNSLGINNINLNLLGFASGGLGERFSDRIRPERRLGGASGLRNLVSTTNVTYIADLINIQRRGNGFSPSRHAARNISGGIANQFFFDIVSRSRDYTRPPRLIIAPTLLTDRTIPLLDSLKNNGISSVAITGLGSSIHGDYGSRVFTTRDEALTHWNNTMTAIKNSGVSFAADGGNAYVLPFADRIFNIPMGSSGFRMTTREIPFFQLAIHGFIPYSGTPGNMLESQRHGFLRMIEYGAFPSFEVFYAESRAIRDANNIRHLSGNYSTWISEILRNYNTMQEFFELTNGSPMLKHENIMRLVYATTYENGGMVIVNYRNEDIFIFDKIVPAMGYVFIRGA